MADEKSVMAVIRAARPTFRNNHDKVAFAVHASFLAAGYQLIATGPPAFSDDALSSSSTDEVGIENWNELEDEYAFVYLKQEKGGKKVLVKCLAMDDKLTVDALADGHSEPLHCDINVRDFVGDGSGGSNYSVQFKDLIKLVKILNEGILSKLDGSSMAANSSTNTRSRPEADNGSRRRTIEPDVYLTEPRGPHYHPSGVVIPPVHPVGGSDLFPGPGAGVYPSRGGYGGGDMLLGPNDPRWGTGVDPSFTGGIPGVPPGARFDPYGPPGVPGFEPNRFTREPRRPGGRIHPDLEQPGRDRDFI